jgi:ribosomal protein L40E
MASPKSTRICASCGTTYGIREARCPDCGTHNIRARDDGEQQRYVDPDAWRCTWQSSVGGMRCGFPGAIHVGDTKGGGRGICRHHRSPDSQHYSDWVVQRSQQYRGGEHPSTRELVQEYEAAIAARTSRPPFRRDHESV